MQVNDTHQTIARYLHQTKPQWMQPGRDVGMSVLDEHSLIVHIPPLFTVAVVTYQPGPDLFDVTISDGTPKVREYAGVFCDQLGDLIYGAGAGAFTEPMVQIFEIGDDGEPRLVAEI